jgi:hypothetical protein
MSKPSPTPPTAKPATQMNPGDEAPRGTPGTGEATCRRCGGTGRIGGGSCPDCGGTGKVIQGVSGG